MTNYEALCRHINREGVTIILKSPTVIIWQYGDMVTADTFTEDGEAIDRMWWFA